jgi:ABC-2 type transport system permease protein
MVTVCGLLTVALVATSGAGHLTFPNIFGVLSVPGTVLLPVLAILLVTSECGQRTALVTFSIEPRRGRIVVAKLTTSLVLVIASILVAAVLAAAGTLASAALRTGVTGEWTVPADVFRNAVVILFGHLLQAFGFAMLIRRSAAAIVAYFALPTAWTVVASVIPWVHVHLQIWLDFSAATAVFTNGQAPFQSAHMVTGAQWMHLAVSGVLWVLLPLAVGSWCVVRAEVK